MTLLPDAYGGQHLPEIASEKLELIWQMGFATLSETDNELRLPNSISESLKRSEIAYLEDRLSQYLGVPVVSFKDLSMDTYRILRMPEMQKMATSPAGSMSPTLSSCSISSSSPSNANPKSQARQYGKKSKIPRPPNAFILYRQKHHPLLKAQKPQLHNNQISVILGNQWKNESPEVRKKFKELSEELKRQHHIKFPDYQYAPRKPSEKKRRMTARKLATLQAENSSNDSSDFPMVDLDAIDQNSDHAALVAALAAVHPNPQDIPTIEDIFGLNSQSSHVAVPPVTTYGSLDDDLNEVFTEEQIALMTQNTTFTAPTNNVNLLNSLIDWTAFDNNDNNDATTTAAAAAAFGNANQLPAQVAQVVANQPWVMIHKGMDKDAFEKELQRTLHYFD